MSKPDWKDAPEWANYLAYDSDGVYTWYEFRPQHDFDDHVWCSIIKGRYEYAGEIQSWDESLEERPNE